MSSIFTPSQAVDVSKEKDWPMHLGMLDWDNTKIVFTKRSLLEFLKYTGVTVDPGFTNIQKLPRYAQFGNMTVGCGSEAEETTVEETTSPSSAPQSTAISGVERLLGEEFPDDALATAQPRRARTTAGASSMGSIFSDDNAERFVPTRRVRQRPGGADNIESLF